MKQWFGTDGIRGAVGSECITPAFFYRLGYAVAQVFMREGVTNLLIGCDTRESCASLLAALRQGASAAGLRVACLGVAPTPAVAWLTCRREHTMGAVISASHNVYSDNGIKFFSPDGYKLTDECELAIESAIHTAEATLAVPPLVELAAAAAAVPVDSPALLAEYREYCVANVAMGLDVSSLTVVVDTANGAMSDVALPVLRRLSVNVIPMHYQPNGKNINAECGSTHPASLQAAVLAHQADLGVAFDGDGDRLIVVDSAGDIVDGDQLLGILLAHQQQSGVSCTGVVGTLMSNLGLVNWVAEQGLQFERAQVGDRYVLAQLLARGWTLGGESSGHIIDLRYSTTGDGLIALLQLFLAMRAGNCSVQQLAQPIAICPQVLVNVPMAKPQQCIQDPVIQALVADGERELGRAGRILVRASGTESCVRVMVEGEVMSEIQAMADDLASQIDQYAKTTIKV